MEQIDLLISSKWVIPVIPENTVYEDCSIAIDKGRILAILPTAEALRKFTPTDHTQLGEHVVIPGLINLHGHAGMALLRGYADDHALHTWLNDHIWPAEASFVSEEFVRDGSALAMAEMVRSGTTCFSDMYFFPDAVASLAVSSGMRCQVTFPVLDFPSAWARDADEYLHKGLQLHDEYNGYELVKIAFGPHAPYTVSDQPLQKIATYAEELDSNIQIHLHETASEVNDALNSTGKRPTERLNELGLLGPRTQCVHMTQLNNADIELLNTTNAHVVHCPRSNLKLASGFCPVSELLQQSINVALGTDSAASNNKLDMLGEMNTAALVAKAVSGDAQVIDAFTALQMATINGAKALGWDDRIGSIERDKYADLTAIDLSDLEHQPVYHPLSQLVYTAPSSQVSHVWVQGNPILVDRQLTTLNTQEIAGKAKQWQNKIAS